MKLYYVPQTRSTRARWMLEEIGAPYELVRLDVARRQNREPAYLALNPLGQVPTLVDGEAAIYETSAICMYLADKFPDKGLAPPPGSLLRGPYYQWCVYGPATIEPALVLYFEHHARLPEGERVVWIAEKMRARLHDAFAGVARSLGEREFLVGDRFTTADLLLGSVLGWARISGTLGDFPSLEAYSKRMLARDAAKRARAD
ncbi:MAG TPA: glutathione S-transferase family protein [Haliangiales bacterium]|nr:glutathione S-transferase family protein [Haliangiales bacterium]